MSGDVPPPLSGVATATLGGAVYVFGGCLDAGGSMGAAQVPPRGPEWGREGLNASEREAEEETEQTA